MVPAHGIRLGMHAGEELLNRYKHVRPQGSARGIYTPEILRIFYQNEIFNN